MKYVSRLWKVQPRKQESDVTTFVWDSKKRNTNWNWNVLRNFLDRLPFSLFVLATLYPALILAWREHYLSTISLMIFAKYYIVRNTFDNWILCCRVVETRSFLGNWRTKWCPQKLFANFGISWSIDVFIFCKFQKIQGIPMFERLCGNEICFALHMP